MIKDIIILGPTSSGKSYLANYLAGIYGLPVFNCDSVQIYKELNELSGKPTFIEQNIIAEEVVSKTQFENDFDEARYENFEFKIINTNEGGVVYLHSDNQNLQRDPFPQEGNIQELLQRHGNLQIDSGNIRGSVENYLFDVRNPTEKYYTGDFDSDIKRIVERFGIQSKIITGGTIYYAYNYIFQLNNENNLIGDFDFDRSEIEKLSEAELIREIQDKDPEAFEFIKKDNRRRLESVVSFLRNNPGRKYSLEYFRPHKILPNTLIILIYPKDRKKYYETLDAVIDKRLNLDSLKEIEGLINKYGEEIIPWLEKLSYEYKYFLKIYFTIKEKFTNLETANLNNQDILQIMQELKYKEHQYAKRQITFMRRLEKRV